MPRMPAIKVAADAVRAQHTIRQLQASTKVARLEYEVAQANIDAVQLQVQNGHANAQRSGVGPCAMSPTVRCSCCRASSSIIRAQLQLLRQTGELHGWALGE